MSAPLHATAKTLALPDTRRLKTREALGGAAFPRAGRGNRGSVRAYKMATIPYSLEFVEP